jgi:hypothetical protein
LNLLSPKELSKTALRSSIDAAPSFPPRFERIRQTQAFQLFQIAQQISRFILDLLV